MTTEQAYLEHEAAAKNAGIRNKLEAAESAADRARRRMEKAEARADAAEAETADDNRQIIRHLERERDINSKTTKRVEAAEAKCELLRKERDGGLKVEESVRTERDEARTERDAHAATVEWVREWANSMRWGGVGSLVSIDWTKLRDAIAGTAALDATDKGER